MKKIIITLFLVFGLISCGNTSYKDLPEKEKIQIQATAFGLTFKSFGKALKGETIGEDKIKKNLKEKYPNVDFGDFSELEKDIKKSDGLKNIIKNIPMF